MAPEIGIIAGVGVVERLNLRTMVRLIMPEYRKRFIILGLVAALAVQVGVVSADTWRLEKGRDLKAVSAEGKDKYLLAVAEIKKLVNTGRDRDAIRAFDKLKKDFPKIAGPDLDAFIEAEMLFCKGKFIKAIRSYDKLMAEYPKSELYPVAIDRQFAIGTAFLAGQKIRVLGIFKMRAYDSGVKIMDKISDRAGDTTMAIKAAMAIAESYERRRKFNDAYHQWSNISSRWPTGRIGRDALLNMARCKHAAYRGPKYDASSLVSAKSYYENFKLRYPENAEELGIEKTLKQIEEQLAAKQFSVGQYYQKAGNKQSANLYYNMVVDNWPVSNAAKMAKKMMSDE